MRLTSSISVAGTQVLASMREEEAMLTTEKHYFERETRDCIADIPVIFVLLSHTSVSHHRRLTIGIQQFNHR
jgi:hypothetical protein